MLNSSYKYPIFQTFAREKHGFVQITNLVCANNSDVVTLWPATENGTFGHLTTTSVEDSHHRSL